MQTTKLAQRLTQAERELSELQAIKCSYQLPRSDRASLDKRIARAEQRRRQCRAELQSIAQRTMQDFTAIIRHATQQGA